jgi:hypothetical protein
MPNRHIGIKKRSTRLIRQQTEQTDNEMTDVFPLPNCAKNRQNLTCFPLCSASDAEESHLSTTELLCTPSCVGAISSSTPVKTSPSHYRQPLPASFTKVSCTNRFYVQVMQTKNSLKSTIKTKYKNKPFRCTYSYEKSCT